MQYFYVYMLKCNDDSYYIGHTDDLKKRIAEHNAKKFCGYTSTRLPVTLVFTQHFVSRSAAMAGERKLKKWTRKKKEILEKYGWEGFQKTNK